MCSIYRIVVFKKGTGTLILCRENGPGFGDIGSGDAHAPTDTTALGDYVYFGLALMRNRSALNYIMFVLQGGGAACSALRFSLCVRLVA